MPEVVGQREIGQSEVKGLFGALFLLLKEENQRLRPNVMIDLPPVQVVCIAQAVYGEARGESDLGKRAVAHVILNRAKKRGITPCQVIREPGQFQFKYKTKYSGKTWKKCYTLALYPGGDPTGGATYFRVRKLGGTWGRLRITTSIGNHNFYK